MLDSRLLALTADVRALLARGLEALSRSDGDTATLKQALQDLDGPFLLVVAGEFNSGKSSLLNALLGDEFLKEGVTPTTDRVNLIGYGPEAKLEPISPELVLISLPHPMLKDLRMVDTPGTNAIVQHHQVLTQQFLPRADLILFVTSADRPFTQSEAEFLKFIKAWGKKIVLVINKMDLLTPPELQQVLDFVRSGADKTLGSVPHIFAISSRRAKQGDKAASNLGQLETHIQTVLGSQAAAIKLGSPLGVLARVIEEHQPTLQTRLKGVESQLATCRELDALALRHEERTRRDFAGQIALVSQSLDAVRERGEKWLEEKVRISNVLNLLNSAKLKQSFLDEVVAGANADIEKGVLQAMSWLAKRDKELLEDALHLLKEAPGLRYPSSPQEESIEDNVQQALATFRPEEEAQFLRDHIQEGLQQTAIFEVGAVGIGAGLLLIFNRIFLDVLGIFTGLIVAVIGLTILPRRKEQAKARLRERIADLRGRIEAALAQNLELELTRTRERFQSLYRTSYLRLEGQAQTLQGQIDEQDQLRDAALEMGRKLGS
ncbi:MAG: dynamin family protein [Meiothermus sp.]|nr:dynamin family protein [Meiothermus sp.]